MAVQLICLSHSPLMNTAIEATDESAQAAFFESVDAAAAALTAFEPDLVVAFYPDHFLGFFYDLLPSFCIGLAAESIEEFGVERETLRVPRDLAMRCGQHLLANGFDPAISHSMSVDHGLTLPLLQLTGGLDRYEVLPIFVNCAGFPRPSFRRVREFGAEVGQFLNGTDLRVVITGSGGLSHDAPSARVANLAPERVLARHTRSSEEQHHFETLGVETARKMMGGESEALMPNPEWDHRFLEDISQFNIADLDALADSDIERDTGYGTHEVRTWVAAAAAARAMGEIGSEVTFYQVIPEWITGMGVMVGHER